MHTFASLIDYLTSNQIAFTRYDHPALFTCEDSSKLELRIPGADTKNLFLRDEKGERIFLVTVSHHKRVSLKELQRTPGVKKLSFGSEALMLECLGVTPGAVTVLGVINDSQKRVRLIIDSEVWTQSEIQMHPLVNTATFVVPKIDLEKLLNLVEHPPTIMDVPSVISGAAT